jgi:hypothetical protein
MNFARASIGQPPVFVQQHPGAAYAIYQQDPLAILAGSSLNAPSTMQELAGFLLAVDYIPITDPCGGGPGYEYSFNMSSFMRAMSDAQFLVEPFLKYHTEETPKRLDPVGTARRATGLFYFHAGMDSHQTTSMLFPAMVYECMKYANPVLRRYSGMPAEYMTINRGVIEYLKCWAGIYTKPRNCTGTQANTTHGSS